MRASIRLGLLVTTTSLLSVSPLRAADVQFSDDPIRSFAVSTVTPVYPASAILSGQTGVVVARIQLDEERRLRQIEILEAPSLAFADAVKVALAQWRFRRPQDDPENLQTAGARVNGKVTFYFFQRDGRYHVAGPKDAPNLRERGGRSRVAAALDVHR